MPAPTCFLVQDLKPQRDPRRGRREPPRQAHERRRVVADVGSKGGREFGHELVQRGLDVLVRRELSVVLVAVAVFAGRRRDEELGGRKLAEHQVLFLLAIQPRLNLRRLGVWTAFDVDSFGILPAGDLLEAGECGRCSADDGSAAAHCFIARTLG